MNDTERTRNNSRNFLGDVLADIFRLLIYSVLGALFFVGRYMLRTPQPLKSDMSGEDRLFHWTHGHVFYKIAGAQDAPPLVLLHAPELAASSYEMRGIIEPLAARYRVYALDLPGFGLSDHPRMAYSGDLYAALLRDFLTQVVVRPATLVASDLSANYAISVASSTPGQVERLVALSPTGLFATGKQEQWYTPVLHNPFVGLSLYAFLTTRLVLRIALSRSFSPTMLSPVELDHYFAAAHQFGAEHAVIAFMAGDLSLDVTHQLETLQQPVLVIWGFQALQRTLHSSQTFATLRDGSTAPLLALTDTSNTDDGSYAVMLLQDAAMHRGEEQQQQVASAILAWNAQAMPQEAVVADEYTGEEEEILPSDEPVSERVEVVTPTETQGVEEVEAYCVKCKQKRIMSDPRDTVTKNGRSAKEGTCPVCGTRLFRFVAG